MPILNVLIQVVPFTLMGLFASGISLWLLPSPISPTSKLIHALVLSLSFIGLLALKRTTNWNLVLLITFGLLVGAFAGSLYPEMDNRSWCYSSTLAALLGLSSAFFSSFLKTRTRELGTALWALIWVYLFGWVVLILVGWESIFQRVWAGFGLALVAAICATWFSAIRFRGNWKQGSDLGIDLYLIILSLILHIRTFFSSNP